VSEIANKIIARRLRSTIIDQNVPKELWPELLEGTIHVVNRTATSAIEGKTLYQSFIDQLHPNQDNKPSVAYLRVLGCKVYVQILE
jgi:hypothetical protein